MLWLLALVPVALVVSKLVPTAHTLLFVLSVLAIVPLAALLGRATESVAARTGVHYKQRAFGLVPWRSTVIRLRGLCHHSLPVATASAMI